MCRSLILVPPLGVMVFALSIIFYFAMFCGHLLEACSFLVRDRKGVDLDGRRCGQERGRVEGGAAVVRTLHF